MKEHRERLAEEFDKQVNADKKLRKPFCVGCLLVEQKDMRLVEEEKKEGEGEVMIFDKQFGCRKTKRRPRSVDSIPSLDSYLVFPFGGGRIN